MRKALKLPEVTRFEDITRDRDVLAELRKGYTSPADVDLWVGGLCETDRSGSMMATASGCVMREPGKGRRT
jgi:hypothetical protein